MNHDITKFLARPRIPRSINTIFLSQCDTAEILKIIGELDSNKASNMNISVLKSCSAILVSHLVNFFNKFLDDGIFPIILKTGLITPILKKVTPDNLTITVQYPHYLFLVKYWKKLYLTACVASCRLRIRYQKINLVLERCTQQAMP